MPRFTANSRPIVASGAFTAHFPDSILKELSGYLDAIAASTAALEACKATIKNSGICTLRYHTKSHCGVVRFSQQFRQLPNAAQRFSHFLLKAFVSRVMRRICIRTERF